MPGKDANRGAKRARETRDLLGLAPEAPVGCLLTVVERRLGLPVVIAALPDAIAGCCWRDGERVVLWVNGTQPAVRQRFTLAHELGHVRCGHDRRVAVDTFETLAGRTTDANEIQANAFAAQLLAPATGVRAMVSAEPTLDDVVLIAARYGISTIAAVYRLRTLELTDRGETLRSELEQGLDRLVWERLAPAPVCDEIGALDRATLPRMSPSLADSALAAVVAGAGSIEHAAGAAGCDPVALAHGAATIGG